MSLASPRRRRSDALLSPAVITVRWGTVIIGLLLAAVTEHQHLTLTLTFGGVLLANAMWRTARPSASDLGGAVVRVVNETALTVVAVAATGWLSSPFVVILIAPIAAATQVRAALRRADEQRSQAMDQLVRLNDANTLLTELHEVTRALPTTLDLSQTIASTVGHLREMFEPNAVAVLLKDDAGDSWSVETVIGARLPHFLKNDELIGPLRDALASTEALAVPDLRATYTRGLSATSAGGLYVALRARDRIVGLIAIERVVPGTLDERHRALLTAMADRVAVTIDNARLFGRLRRLGADEERTRIARDLHDRVGQGLAYMSFELDRIGRKASDEVQNEIATLRSDVRQILGEVRETLSDVRADVSEHQDLVATVDAFISRVEKRSDIRCEFDHEDDRQRRLPLPVEREMWRIAQEALSNAERHSGATEVRVQLRCTDRRTVLEVTDDGAGMSNTSPVKPGCYGLTGMRERADSIGAALEIESELGHGTTVRCRLERA